jgi:alpha-tubulin suppressor-like RCC1 family protein
MSPNLGCKNCVPQPTQVPNLYSVQQVEAGSFHTCAYVAGGTAYCWGNGQNGQLGGGQPGAGIYGNSTAPQLVSGGHVFTSIAAGADSSCGSTAGGVYCWGGIGGQGNPLPYPTGSSMPTLIASGAAYTSMTVGLDYACGMVVIPGVVSDVGCFGTNQYGQAGSDPTAWPWVPLDGGTTLGGSVKRVSAQFDFTCADQQNGTVQCFGDNYNGQLGNNGSASTYQAQTVLTSSLQPASLGAVSAGIDHACALSPVGAAYCWGNGLSGQLGNGAAAISRTAVAVQGGRTFRAIAAGRGHSCGIASDNHIWCWGDNTYGQLGIGSAGSWYWSPVQAVDPP